MYKRPWHTPEKGNGGLLAAKVGCPSAYTVTVSILKYTQLYGLITTTKIKGNLRILSSRRGLPNTLQSTTDPYTSWLMPPWVCQIGYSTLNCSGQCEICVYLDWRGKRERRE